MKVETCGREWCKSASQHGLMRYKFGVRVEVVYEDLVFYLRRPRDFATL